jgi:hypothetical protein
VLNDEISAMKLFIDFVHINLPKKGRARRCLTLPVVSHILSSKTVIVQGRKKRLAADHGSLAFRKTG